MHRLCGGLAALLLLLHPITGAADEAWAHFCAHRGLQPEPATAVDAAARAHARSALHFRALMVRGEPWLWRFLEAADARGMPSEVALLPAIESGFRARAESHRAAAGIWQLVPSTARRFGLRVDDTLDHRYDVGFATKAALDYLEYLHDRFDSWPLALAAYNAGEGRLVRALQRIGESPGAPVARDALRLPDETYRHYQRLLGLAEVICDPDSFGVRLPSLPARPLVQLVHLDREAELGEIAALAGIPQAELARINPGWERQLAGAPYRLWIPAHREQRLRERLRSSSALGLADFGAYKVRHGDTLSHIALRHGTSTHALKALNALSDSRIRVGMRLRVPLETRGRREEL